MTKIVNPEQENINMNLYSRQIGAYGLETMAKLAKLNVLIYGMRGVGFEVAKNLILAGPKQVIIFDNNIAKINDLSSNFYITEDNVKNKKRRDFSCLEKLSDLNRSVKVSVMKGDSLLEYIKNNFGKKDEDYFVVVITEFKSKESIIELDNFCRYNNIGFIYGTELGINGFYFVDFGNSFKVFDKNNEDEKFVINSITKENPGKVNLSNSIRGKIKNNDYIIFKEIEGMTELNNFNENNYIKIKYIDEFNIEIQDTSKFSDYISGGYIQKAKIPMEMNFLPFEMKLEVPYQEEDEYPLQIDMDKGCTNELIHLGILALCEFYNKKKSLPALNNKKDAEELYYIANKILINKEKEKLHWVIGLREEIENFDTIFKKLITGLSLWARAQISPIASYLGGLISQSIIKYTGKFIPIKQWFWFNFSEVVDNIDLNAEKVLKGTKYDDQISIFGNQIQNRLEDLNIFMIGAGALGCEFLKVFSLMGISTNKSGNSNVTVTDNDRIEESNLNRQFLFKNEDIGLPKSEVACKIVSNFDKNFKCIPLNGRIGKETEDFFNENFWKKQNIVINAVDNEEARIFINDKCFQYNKILIDSGTNGTKANSQVIIPYKTVGYSPSQDDEKDIPMCTLRNYPTSINHCIEWAMDKYNSYFIDIIYQVKLFVEDKNLFYQEFSKKDFVPQQVTLERIIRYLKIIIKKDYFECVKIAFEEYNELFNDSIKRIISNYPPNFINPDGTKFWSGNKRCPIQIAFDVNNKLAFLFIKSYAKILANELSVPIEKNDILIKKKLNEYLNEYNSLCKNEDNICNNFMEKKKKYYILNNISSEESEELKNKLKKEKGLKTKERLKKKEEKLLRTKEEANKIDVSSIKYNQKKIFNIKEFEKDNDENGHIDFIFATSNLKAQNYKIPNESKIKIKLIAGKIIPAIASTTASIVGLSSLQLYTLCQEYNISSLRDCKFNLANNYFEFSSPIIIKEKNGFNDKWNLLKNKLTEIFAQILQILKGIKYFILNFNINQIFRIISNSI